MSQITVTFIKPDGSSLKAETSSGVSVLQLAQEQGLDIEGACEGNMACSTCHVVVDETHFEKLPAASDDEEDMLYLASGLKATSRLGCQVFL